MGYTENMKLVNNEYVLEEGIDFFEVGSEIKKRFSKTFYFNCLMLVCILLEGVALLWI